LIAENGRDCPQPVARVTATEKTDIDGPMWEPVAFADSAFHVKDRVDKRAEAATR